MSFDKCRADKIVKRQFGKQLPQSIIEKAFKNKDILINGMRAKASTQISENDKITCSKFFIQIASNFAQQNSNKIIQDDLINNFKSMIIFEDKNFIIINKPAGLAVQLGTDTHISIDIIAKTYCDSAKLVHRIDKETSGIVVLAKNLPTARCVLHQFKENKISKKYLAIVSNKNLKHSGKIDIPIKKIANSVIIDKSGKHAITIYKELQKFCNNTSLVEITPKTGRTHQIRVHMKYIGCPILGDKKYGGRQYNHMCLHAYTITLHDINNKIINIKAQPPLYFQQ